MKTLLLALEFPPAVGGVETYYQKVVEYWPDELVFLTNAQKALLSPFLPIFAWLRGLFRVKAIIEQEEPEWVLAGEILPLGTIAYILSFFRIFKYGVFLHGLDFSLATKNVYKRWLSGLILRRATMVICANVTTEQIVKKIFPTVITAVVNPGVETKSLKIKTQEASTLRLDYNLTNAFILVTVGRLVERKGMDMVIQALPEIIKKIPNCYYVVIGDGPYKKRLLELAKTVGVTKQVLFFSGLSDEIKNNWLATSDVFIMPTRVIGGDYEGFGIVYLEAGLYKKPVIAGQGGGVKEAVDDGESGLIIDGADKKSITTAVIRLHDDEILRNTLGINGYNKAVSMTWSKQVKKIYSLLEAI